MKRIGCRGFNVSERDNSRGRKMTLFEAVYGPLNVDVLSMTLIIEALCQTIVVWILLNKRLLHHLACCANNFEAHG